LGSCLVIDKWLLSLISGLCPLLERAADTLREREA